MDDHVKTTFLESLEKMDVKPRQAQQVKSSVHGFFNHTTSTKDTILDLPYRCFTL